MRDDVDFELYALLDYDAQTALRYDGIEEFPEAWLDENLGGPIGFGFIRSEAKVPSIQMSNPNALEDMLFIDLAKRSATADTMILFWLSVNGYPDRSDRTAAKYQEIVLVQTFASRNEDYLTAIKNQT